MSRRGLLLIALIALVAPGCQSRTELMVGIATDMAAPDVVDEVRLDISRAGTGVPQAMQSWLITGTNEPFNLPGSYGIYTEHEALPVEITLTGFKNGTRVVSRTARMNLVEGQTLFYRMGLTAMCMMKTDCPTGTDCIEGTCKAMEIDSATLPAFEPDLVTHVTCQSRSMYIDTANRAPMPAASGAGACPASQCAEGTCLAAMVDPCNCPAGTTCINNACVGTGALRVTLSWQTTTDIDLHVRTPTGAVINFSNQTADSGRLDVDDQGQGTHVENVFFTAPPAGTYEVWANNFDGAMSTSFTIDVSTPSGSIAGFPVSEILPAMMVDSAHYPFTFSGAGAP